MKYDFELRYVPYQRGGMLIEEGWDGGGRWVGGMKMNGTNGISIQSFPKQLQWIEVSERGEDNISLGNSLSVYALLPTLFFTP